MNLKCKSSIPEKWFTYFDGGPSTPTPGWKIKVDDSCQSPIALLPVQTAKGKVTQARRARLIVKLANEHFRKSATVKTGE